VTLADTPTTLRRLEDALVELVEVHRGTPRPTVASIAWSVAPQQVCPPRAAFFARQETVAAARAVGRTCGELTMSALQAARAAGTRIAYAADPTLATVRVLAD